MFAASRIEERNGTKCLAFFQDVTARSLAEKLGSERKNEPKAFKRRPSQASLCHDDTLVRLPEKLKAKSNEPTIIPHPRADTRGG